MRVVEVVDQFRDHFCIGFTFKDEPFVLQKDFDFPVVGDDAVVDDDERVLQIGALRMRVHLVRLAMGRPASVGYAAMGLDHRVAVQFAVLC